MDERKTDYSLEVAKAIRHFWEVRTRQHDNQGAGSGRKDAGNRRDVTGGKQLDGFIELMSDIVSEAGLPRPCIHVKETTLPGYFRPTKNWDLVVVAEGRLLASIEFKSQCGPSYGNNFNNRVEEALGSSIDILTAYREGKFPLSGQPWLGWMMVLEEDYASLNMGKKIKETHFKVFPDFRNAPYAKRYELFCERIMRERLYNRTCLILSEKNGGLDGGYREPNPEMGFNSFAASLKAHIQAFVDTL